MWQNIENTHIKIGPVTKGVFFNTKRFPCNKKAKQNILKLHILTDLFDYNVSTYIWVGFTRTGILPVSRHLKKNFAGPLWPNMIC